jgi:hypothetical protein
MLELSLIHVVVFQIIQIVPVNSTAPCFLNLTAGADMWQNCNAAGDFLTFSMQMWQWETGGYFSMIFISILVVISYIKYQKMVYPMLVGLFYLPLAFFLFPSQFITFAVVLGFTGLGLLIAWVFISQTNES